MRNPRRFHILNITLALAALLWGAFAPAATAPTYASLPSVFGRGDVEEGYVDDASLEVSNLPQEMVLVQKPAWMERKTIHEFLFNDALTREFTMRYHDQFGMSEMEETYFMVNRQGYYISNQGFTPIQVDQSRRQFAEYMIRRMAEYHAENWMKTDPQLKKIYEVKQKVTNIQVEVGPQTKIETYYSVVGNFAVANLKNPAFEASLVLNMASPSLLQMSDAGPVGITLDSGYEIRASYKRFLTRVLILEAGYSVIENMARLQLTRLLSPQLSVNLVQTSHLQALEFDGRRESLTLAGFNYTF